MASEMRSQTLSGWPSDTDSLVKTKFCFAKRPISLSIRLSRVPSAYHRRVAIGKGVPHPRDVLVECRAVVVKPDSAGAARHYLAEERSLSAANAPASSYSRRRTPGSPTA